MNTEQPARSSGDSRAVAACGTFIIILAIAPGCGGGECAPPPDDTGTSVSASFDQTTLSWDSFNSSPNNDCTPMQGDVTSLTLDGRQTGATAFHITFCLPRPDQIGSDPIPFTNEELIEVIDINAQVESNCILILNRVAPKNGSIQFAGYCEAGLADHGYGITLSGTLPATVVCTSGMGSTNTDVTLDLSGSALVDAL